MRLQRFGADHRPGKQHASTIAEADDQSTS
jgi:hypothetical protein